MKELTEYIVKQLVNNPEAVEITEDKQGDFIEINLKVDPADMGIVIGKGGQTIKAIRRLLTIPASSQNFKVNLRLVEPE